MSRELLELNTEYQDDTLDEPVNTVEIHRFGHWGPGWYEIVLIHPSNELALRAADEWAAALDDYPVADEEHFSETEMNEVYEWWESSSLRDRIELLSGAGDSIFAARREEIPEDTFYFMCEHLDIV